MRRYWHTRDNSSGQNNPNGQARLTRLILIFNGSGFDERVLSNVAPVPGADMLLVYDYTEITPELLSCAHNYERVDLIAWSFGVYAADYCAAYLPEPARCIAVNGTLTPVDDCLGIPVQIFESTLQTYDEVNRKRFQMRLAGGASAYRAMQKQLPQREVLDQLNELKAMGDLFKKLATQHLNWDKAIVAKGDKIFPPENMKAAWGELAYEAEGEHFIAFERILGERQ